MQYNGKKVVFVIVKRNIVVGLHFCIFFNFCKLQSVSEVWGFQWTTEVQVHDKVDSGLNLKSNIPYSVFVCEWGDLETTCDCVDPSN